MIVYPGQRFLQNPLEGFPDAVLGRSENGWMDSELFLTWLRDVFIPSVEQRGVKKPIVLFVNGHSTHLNLAVSELCKEHNILLYCLLEQASHLIQPCDLKLFSVLKIRGGRQFVIFKWKMSVISLLSRSSQVSLKKHG